MTSLYTEETTYRRFRAIAIFRIAIAGLLMGVMVSLHLGGGARYLDIVLPHFYAVLVLSLLLSFFFLYLLGRTGGTRVHLYIQALSDIILITALVYVTGGIRSNYAVFYPLVIIYAVIIQGREGGVLAASGAAIAYGLLVDLEYYRLIPSPGVYYFMDYPFSAPYVFLRISVHILSFYLIAFLAAFITERETKTREMLREKESAFNRLDRLYRSIVESVEAGILTIDHQGRIKSLNRGGENITGFTAREVEDMPLSALFPDLGEAPSPIGRTGRRDIAFRSRDGERKILGLSMSPLFDERGERIGTIVIFQDLTKVRKMEETIERNRRLALLGEMAATLAHELRNPLASISSSIQLLKKDLTLSEMDARLMGIILRGKDQIEGFIKDFLQLSRISPMLKEKVFPREVLEEVIEAVRATEDWRESITFGLDVEDEGPFWLSRSDVRQILWNLILNAVQAMPRGGRVGVTIGRVKRGEADVLLIRVADEGEGSGGRDLDMFLEPFYTTKDGGTGLGLAIVNRIVSAYDGRMDLADLSPRGLAVTVELPLSASQDGRTDGEDTGGR